MTWTPHMFYSGEGDDHASEIASRAHIGHGFDTQSVRARTGARGLELRDFAPTGNGWSFGTVGNGLDEAGVAWGPPEPQGDIRGLVCQGAYGVTNDPTTKRRLFGDGTVDSGPGVYINTDRTIHLQGSGANEISGTHSTTKIPTTGLMDVVALWWKDTHDVWWFWLWMDGAFENGPRRLGFFHWKTPNTREPGSMVVGSTDFLGGGFDLFVDDWCWSTTTDNDDAPWLTKYPFIRGVFLPPQADGGDIAWNKGAGAWADVDELGGHDADVSFNQTTTDNAIHTHQWTLANPVPSGATIDGVQIGGVGRETGDGKDSAFFWVSGMGSTVKGTGCQSGSTTYRGARWIGVPRPGGGAWVRDDFDPGDWDFGFKAPPVDAGTRMTLIWAIALYHETGDLIDLSAQPPRSDVHVRRFFPAVRR